MQKKGGGRTSLLEQLLLLVPEVKEQCDTGRNKDRRRLRSEHLQSQH